MAVGWCAKSSYTVTPFTAPRTSSRRLTLRNAASAASACAGGTPAWRAAATAASALCILCSPASVHDASPCGVPAHDTSKRLASGLSGVAFQVAPGVPRAVFASPEGSDTCTSLCIATGTKIFHRRPATHGQRFRERRVGTVRHDQPRGRHDAHEVVQLLLDGREIGENIGVVVFEVVENGRARAVVHELRALVEKRGVVFVRLDDEKWIFPRRADTPKFSGTPPMRNPGSRPACSSIHASMLAVVVLPWVPATAITQRPGSTCSPIHCAPEV